jgi:hypothetical protein
MTARSTRHAVFGANAGDHGHLDRHMPPPVIQLRTITQLHQESEKLMREIRRRRVIRLQILPEQFWQIRDCLLAAIRTRTRSALRRHPTEPRPNYSVKPNQRTERLFRKGVGSNAKAKSSTTTTDDFAKGYRRSALRRSVARPPTNRRFFDCPQTGGKPFPPLATHACGAAPKRKGNAAKHGLHKKIAWH